ncbi:MAG: OmpH family outer membrane protein [Candidatus Abyssobacteria bacterium SURF_17]|uniref:OmpH family outer membrane protein n=1 Tax=Candidatus Abyssobacteria bacterium SURF_17 TaxID=2093361 RepID=A0A419F7Y0_9BACT|nr:MAG: OmpH family outer membrane protein [Candidatus Abyssubacteria bacterium SURF_17]
MEVPMLREQVRSRSCVIVFLVLSSTVLLLAGAGGRALAAQEAKVGYLDLDRVVQAVAKQTPEYEDLSKELEKRQAEVERRRAEIDKLEDELKANRVIWSEDKAKEQEKLIRDKIDDLKVYSEGAQRYKDVEENKILRRLLPDIAKVVKQVGERDGYGMIFERRILLYGSPTLDLTDAIIKEMTEKR